MFKKLLILLLSVTMILTATSCTSEVVEEPTTVTSEEFEAQMLEWFKEDMADDFLTYHFSLVDASAYGIEKPEVSFGTLEDEDYESQIDERIAYLESIDTSELTDDEIITYQSLVSYYDLLKRDCEIEVSYTFLFTPNGGANNNVITYLTEFEIRSEEDTVDLIELAADADRYIDECIEYTKQQAEDGIVQTDAVIESVIEQCELFISKVEDNEIITSFEAQLADFGFENNDEYIEQMSDIVVNEIIPAYERIIEMYEELQGQGLGKTLADYGDDGKAVYEILFEYESSSSVSVTEYEQLLLDAINEKYDELIYVAYSDMDAYYDYYYEDYSFGTTDAYEILTTIKAQMGADFPEYPEVDYTVDYLDPTVTSENVSAYYVTAPVDDYNHNVVKINPSYSESDPNGFIATLAHEAYPGHLYQTTYYLANFSDNVIRYTLNFLGYTEGWAMYVEEYAVGYFGIDENIVSLINIDTALSYYLEAYLDILVNYEGYSVDMIADVLDELGFVSSAAQSIYDTLVGDPCLFVPYAVGLYNYKELQEKAQSSLGVRYSSIDFNQVLLDTGATTFEILEAQVDKYIASKTTLEG